MKIAVIGTTSWGTTLGILLANKGYQVTLWARTNAEADQINVKRENSAHLPGVTLPEGINATISAADTLKDAALTILAVPSQSMRNNLDALKSYFDHNTLILSVSKGIEIESQKRMSELITEKLPPMFHNAVAVLSGPNFSKEVALNLPTATVISSNNPAVSKTIQSIMSTPEFRAYVNNDLIGVELGGALKNVVAIAVGISDGLGYGDNSRAALITRGLAELTRLGVKLGAKPSTFSGLAGIGDLVATCTSPLSRNRFVGHELAKGKELQKILASMRGISEGVDTTVAVLKLAQRLGVELPIAEQVNKVLFDSSTVNEVVPALMGRELKQESALDF